MKKFLITIIIILIISNIILYKNNKIDSNEIKTLLNNYNTNMQLNNRKDSLYIEVLKDVNAGLAPLSEQETNWMIKNLKSYKIIEGVRGQEGVNEPMFREIVQRVSALVTVAPEIFEMDLNPLLGKADKVVAVDARIRIEKE